MTATKTKAWAARKLKSPAVKSKTPVPKGMDVKSWAKSTFTDPKQATKAPKPKKAKV